MKWVSLARRLHSESKPTLTMPRKRLPLASPTSIRRLLPPRTTSTAASGSVGMPSARAQVVAAAAGDQAQRRLRAGHRAADGADQAVAADHDRHLAELDRAQRQVDAVLEAAGPLDPEGGATGVQRRLDPRQQLQAPASGRGGVDEQGQRHPGDLHSAPSLNGPACGLAAAEAEDREAAVARRFGPDRLESEPAEATPQQAPAEPRGRAAAVGLGKDEKASRAQHPQSLARGRAGVERSDQIELVIRERRASADRPA